VDIVRIFHISLNALKYISARREITTGPLVMKSALSESYFHVYFLDNSKVLKSTFNSVGLSAVVFASAVIAALVSGCARLPDKTAIPPSLSTELGYPNAPVEKMTTASARKSKRMLPVKPASNGYLGRAQYICTPSGFGRTSGCFLRRS
jgi:hypothetical protein